MTAPLAYDDLGSGPPVVAVHGAYSTRGEVRGFLPPMLPGRRIICPDLPGMGDSPADGVRSAADAVDRLDQLVEATIGGEPFLAVGHSFGAHLVRGLTARRARQVSGMVLLCPLVPDAPRAEPARVVVDDGASRTLPSDLREEFEGYFVVRTATTVEAFRSAVAPSLGRFDDDAVKAQMENADLELAAPEVPALILAGRHDSWVGWRQLPDLLDAHPRATGVVVAGAGHALPHERPDAVGAAVRAWGVC